MRLNKYIASSGLCSRRKADQYIEDGYIEINGSVVKDFSYQVNLNSDTVTFQGKPLTVEETKVYYLLRKPKGCLTTVTDDRNRKTVMDFISSPYRIFPIGRLDYNSTGVLLLTNDGDFYQKIKYSEKTYHVLVKESVTDKDIEKLKSGVMIDGKKTRPCPVEKIKTEQNKTLLSFRLTEGRNRQIRKMLESIGKSVLKLDRVKFSFLDYSNLKPGEYRELNHKEIAQLLMIKPSK